jgi:hypothetical protein
VEVEELEVDVDGLVDVTVPLLDVVVAVEEAVDGRIEAAVETGELDFLVKVGV